jgi:hypothetical protein
MKSAGFLNCSFAGGGSPAAQTPVCAATAQNTNAVAANLDSNFANVPAIGVTIALTRFCSEETPVARGSRSDLN